jgi:hypothetical protein
LATGTATSAAAATAAQQKQQRLKGIEAHKANIMAVFDQLP